MSANDSSLTDTARNDGFLGKGWGFPPQFNPKGKSAMMVADEPDINESLTILLSTNPGERVMHPKFGCGLKTMVFREINLASVSQIKELIKRAVLFFEPRIVLETIKIDEDNALEGRLLIELVYTVITTNSRSNLVYPFYLLEGTLVNI